MPKLPDATNLSGVNIGAPRSLVDIPVPDYAGAANAVAQGVRDVGTGVANFAQQRLERAQKQERFDTNMKMLKAREAYAERVRDLDRLDPEYVEKSKAAYREVYEPLVSEVRDPTNRQIVEEEALTDYTNIGIRAGEEHKTARTAKTKIDLETYAEAQVKRLVDDGVDPEKARSSVLQMIQDADLDALTKLELEKQLLEPIDTVAVETKANKLHTGGGGATDKTSAILRNVEGFRATPYWDENAYRIGYGSDTVTRQDGTVVKVVQGMRITKADAERDLARRVTEFGDGAARDSGEAWNNLSPDQQAALTSVAYNYGSLPKRVVKAIQTGDANTIANAVESLADHNGGINRKRREAEAAIIRGGASIPASWNERPKLDDVLAQVEQDPAYLRLTVDKRERVKASIVSRYEKYEKEAEKDAQINTAREAANMAASEFTTLAEGNRWLDENVPNPETREKARTMFKADFEANEKEREAQYKAFLSSVKANVMNALYSGNTRAALEAIPAQGLEPEDYQKMQELVSNGVPEFDDSKILDQLRYMKYSDSEKYKDLNLMDYAPFLKRSTVDGLIADQEKIRKGFEKTGKMPSLEARSKLLNETYDILGLDTSTKVSDTARQANARTQQRIASIFETNVQMAVDLAGRELQPEELRRVRDETLLEFTRKEQKSGWTTNYEIAIQQGLPDVFTLFDEQEAKINAAIEAENQKRIAAGQPVENLRSPGSLLRQAQEELATLNTAERRRVSDEIKAIERGLRSPGPGVRDNAINERYTRLQRERRALEEFEINAQTLYEWLAVTFAPQDRNAE